MIVAVYPGTFDPFTRGHEDIVQRAVGMFGQVVVAVADSRAKSPCFSHAERVALAREVLADCPSVRVVGFSGLLVDLLRTLSARVVVRGVRSAGEFDYEAQLAAMNRHIMPEMETLFMAPALRWQAVSGTLVREIACLGGDISPFVGPAVCAAWHAKQAQA